MKSNDLTGRMFNNLLVLGLGEGKCKNKKYWKCRCTCGNITNVETSKLVSLYTKSCGCIKGKENIIDLTGKKFDYLTVLSFSHKEKAGLFWKCRCVCGKEVVKNGKMLRTGKVTSCGCMHGKKKIKDLTNKKFGKLTVIKFVETSNNNVFWECLCECGNKKIVSSRRLSTGNTSSCGCLKHKPACNRLELKGKTFGLLTVIDYAFTQDKKSFWSCRCKCGKEKIVPSQYLISGDTRSCGCIDKHFSFEEKEVVNFIKSVYKGNVIENDKTLIYPKEIDIYIPEKNFAIEYDGMFWHSEANKKGYSYHLNKTEKCLQKGIRLLHLYDYEWKNKKDICKSMICSALGIYERKEYARKCEVREVKDRKIIKDFFNENHIQGSVDRYSLCLGLYKDNELLQAVLFGRQHFGKNKDFELYRMATKLNTQILGGFSKLMKHSPYDVVISYVALRMFDAKGYLAGKWKIESRSQPSFCITDGIDMFSRHLFKKSACLKKFNNVNKDMTEREMCELNGYYRLWDCGTYRVRWTRH